MQRLKGTTCYLAGPVELVDDCTSWRDHLTPLLAEMGITVWDPMVKPQWFIDEVGELTPETQRRDAEKLDETVKSGIWHEKEQQRNSYIRKVCLRLISSCDFMICRVSGPTVGTFEELALANQQGTPILFYGGDNLDSCWRAAQFGNMDSIKPRKIWFSSTDDLMNHIEGINSGTVEVNSLDWIFLKETGWANANQINI
jgi:nucleoside 2-deoxyribosyltransferase